MNWAASNLANRKEIQRAVQNERLLKADRVGKESQKSRLFEARSLFLGKAGVGQADCLTRAGQEIAG